jgi:hypothetical protein
LLTEKGLCYTNVPENIDNKILDVVFIEENVRGKMKLTKISLLLIMNLNL